jgi:hypothetical protein
MMILPPVKMKGTYEFLDRNNKNLQKGSQVKILN